MAPDDGRGETETWEATEFSAIFCIDVLPLMTGLGAGEGLNPGSEGLLVRPNSLNPKATFWTMFSTCNTPHAETRRQNTNRTLGNV